jgi:hypothetical protein
VVSVERITHRANSSHADKELFRGVCRTPVSRISAKVILVGRAGADIPYDSADPVGGQAALEADHFT